MGMIWRIATPSLEDHQTQDGTSYKWLDYFHEVTSISFAHHNNAQCIISVNDPCTEISTKDDEWDLRVQGKVLHMSNETKWSISFYYCIQNTTLQQQQQETNTKVDWQLPGWFCKEYKYRCYLLYWITLHWFVKPANMDQYSFDQSEADTIIFSFYAVLRESEYTGPVIIGATDTCVYIATAYISHQLPGMLCIKRKQETILCRSLMSEDMARCIVPTSLYYRLWCQLKFLWQRQVISVWQSNQECCCTANTVEVWK